MSKDEKAKRAELERQRRRRAIIAMADGIKLSQEELAWLKQFKFGALRQQVPEEILEQFFELGLLTNATLATKLTPKGEAVIAVNGG